MKSSARVGLTLGVLWAVAQAGLPGCGGASSTNLFGGADASDSSSGGGSGGGTTGSSSGSGSGSSSGGGHGSSSGGGSGGGSGGSSSGGGSGGSSSGGGSGGGSGGSSSGGGSGGGSGGSSSGGGSGGGSGGSSSGGGSGGGSGGSSSGGGSGGGSGSSSGGGCSGPTTVTGTVWDPAQRLPVYNAVVYIPTAPLAAIPTGPSCDICGGAPSGKPAAVALSAADGTFTLKNVPPGTNVPIVVQVGKWRRENAFIPVVTACANTPVDGSVTRLPQSQAEGHLPHIAISTGLDAVECALSTMGVSASEFSPAGGAGRIHLYQGSTTNGATAGTGTLPASSLWGNKGTLGGYDAVIDACQGAPPADKPQAAISNLAAFAGSGGRVLLSHYEDYVVWPTSPTTSPWSGEATPQSTPLSGPAGTVNASSAFPKGAALASWIVSAGVSTTPGFVPGLADGRGDVAATLLSSKPWLSGQIAGGLGLVNNVFQYSFYTGASSCGKVAYSDFHVSAGSSATAFPGECAGAQLDATEEALFEFFLLDATNCAQDDALTPPVPPLK